jgi:RecG-like helicase
VSVDLQMPLQFLRGVGPRRAADLERVGLVTVEDLLFRLPLRYERTCSSAFRSDMKIAPVSFRLAASGLDRRRPSSDRS